MTGTAHRIEWRPGTDELAGICHCGATRLATEPIELWQWLLAHPEGHYPAEQSEPAPPRLAAAIGSGR